ncbi:hypothetical protein Emed_006237 [Eimeria media]
MLLLVSSMMPLLLKGGRSRLGRPRWPHDLECPDTSATATAAAAATAATQGEAKCSSSKIKQRLHLLAMAR